jgi:Tfp pilus assembly protein PilF
LAKRKRHRRLPAQNLPAPPAGKIVSRPAEKLFPVISFLLVFVTALAFWQVGSCGFINFDDNIYVTGNSRILQGITADNLLWAFTAGRAANWHPLTWISHMVDIQLFGLRPTWHHLVNLYFHIASTVLLFLVLYRMTRALWQSAFVAALFALHPLHVESVAWVAERKDVLSTFFFMLTMMAYVRYVERPGLKRYLAVNGCFVLGLLSKPMVVTLPFVLLLLDYWPLGRLSREGPLFRWSTVRPLLAEKAPLFLLVFLSCVVTYFVQRNGGAMAAMKTLPLDARIANALVSYAAYMGKMVWPLDLAVLYPHPVWWPVWKVAVGAAVLFLFTVLAVIVWKKLPYLAVGWFWYVGTLIPVIGIVQVGSQAMADRYAYIPLIGLFVIAAWGIPELVKKLPWKQEMLAALAVLCLACLFFRTWGQVSYWHNDITLYDHTLAVTGRNGAIYMNRGLAYWALKNYSAAITDLKKAIEIDPGAAPPYGNLGIVYNSLRDYPRAIEAFNKAVAISPRYAPAYHNRGIAYGVMGDHTKAIADFTRAMNYDPLYIYAYYNRGMAYRIIGDNVKAIADFTKAVELDPGYAEAYRNRGVAYGAVGDHAKAIADFNKARNVVRGTSPYTITVVSLTGLWAITSKPLPILRGL